MTLLTDVTAPQNKPLNTGLAVRALISLAFLFAVMLFVNWSFGLSTGGGTFLIVAAMVGGYMALNIGANDVANNVGPSVGSGALTMAGAIALAGVFEIAGALVAGGDVVGTIKSGIIDPGLIGDPSTFIWLMLAALFAGAVWLNIATYLGAPVSTTHSIVGGLMGAGIAAGGWNIVNWDKMMTIAASWVISPVLGGTIAATFLYLTTRLIFDQKDLVTAARRFVPYLLGVMAWVFVTYLALKGLKKIWNVDFIGAAMLGTLAALAVVAWVRPQIVRASGMLPNSREGINALFTIPLIFAAALLSFAHGANDVANAIGPLAAINDTLVHGGVAARAAIPFWVLVVGAIGIALGLALYGPRLIRTVGSEITQLDKMSAFCVALAAAITVILASQLGLPVSSTHIAVGGVIGVGFLREYLNHYRARMNEELAQRVKGDDRRAVANFLTRFRAAAFVEQAEMIRHLRKNRTPGLRLSRKDSKALKSVHREELVKRSLLIRIVAAWLITVPASAAIAGLMFFAIRGFMLP